MRKVPTIAIAIALGTLATSAQAQFAARTPFTGTFSATPSGPLPCGTKDDGVTENALGLVAGGEIGWIKVLPCDLVKYDSVGTAYGTLMFPGSVTNGANSRLVTYTSPSATDPNDPSWVPTNKVVTVVTNGDTDIINKFSVPHTTRPTGTNTMVLASANQVAGQFPGPMDQGTANPDAWVVGSTLGPDTLNTTTLTANNVPPTNMTAIGFPSTWLLRVVATQPCGGGGNITPVCFGDGTQNGGINCPCGNNSTLGGGGGCANGAPMPPLTGATLTATGSTSISGPRNLQLTAGFVTNQPGLFFQGDNTIAGGNGLPFGDGIRCCGGNVDRLEIVDPPGPNGPNTISTSVHIIGTPPTVTPGDKRCYQYWYRNPNRSLCGANFNLSNALSIVFTP